MEAQQNRTFKNNQGKFYWQLNSVGRNYERQKFLIRKRHTSFGGVSVEKENNTGKLPNGLKNFKRDFEYKKEQEGSRNYTRKD